MSGASQLTTTLRITIPLLAPAVIAVATHEFGHFAGLGHADGSPALTMFPYVGDGAQTLGLGDMLGILELY